MPSFMNIQVAIIVNDPGNVYIWTIALDAGSSDDKATHFSLCLGTCDICHVADCCDVCFVLTMILLNVNVQRDTNAPAPFYGVHGECCCYYYYTSSTQPTTCHQKAYY